ncbi:hypothetical protein L195_g029047 [Trifolium pratense]|uniref:RNase H type-1 domain-containing protein n=1 Tax=Trifolium pratense TaxID=57577 RepID=A0A2K3L3Q3_TRIPR|nr:hypothetical protein L195_g029047 [Trifolium pratense]
MAPFKKLYLDLFIVFIVHLYSHSEVDVENASHCWRGEDARIGCGGIIRGSNGGWLGGFVKYVGHVTTYVAELWGVYEGLQVARRINFLRVEACGFYGGSSSAYFEWKREFER